MPDPRSVSDLMTKDPDSVQPETPLREVIDLMRTEGCRQLPVVDAENCVVGIVTDRDVRLAMNSPLVLHERWQDESLLDAVTAEGCMTIDPITVSEDTPLSQAAQILSDRKFGALPVTRKGKLVGIISVTDLLQQFILDRQQQA